MKIDVMEDEVTIRLKEVFNSVVFETEEGERLAVCMRDGSFEIATSHKDSGGSVWFKASTQGIEKLQEETK